MKCVECGCGMTPNKNKRPAKGTRRHSGRGLCTACYRRLLDHGRLHEHERRSMPRDMLLDDWVLLRDQGVRPVDAADRLGVSWDALDRALCRALAAGDPRGRRARPGVDFVLVRRDGSVHERRIAS